MTTLLETATHKKILTQIASVIAGMDLDGISDANVAVCLFPAPEYLKELQKIDSLPCILVSPYASEDMTSGGTNIQDDYGYPCLVTIAAATDQNLEVKDKYLFWRESIIKKFHNKNAATIGFTGLTNVWRTTAKPGQIADFAAFQSTGFFTSYVTILVVDRSARS